MADSSSTSTKSVRTYSMALNDSMTRKNSLYMCCLNQCALYRNRLADVYGKSPMKAKTLLHHPVVVKSAPYLNFVAPLSTAIAEGRNSRAGALSESMSGDKDLADKDIKACCEDMNLLEKWLLSFILDSPHRAYRGVLAVNEDTYNRLQDIVRTLEEYLRSLLPKKNSRSKYVRQVKVRVIRPPGTEQYFDASYLASLERIRQQHTRAETTPVPKDRVFRAVLQYQLDEIAENNMPSGSDRRPEFVGVAIPYSRKTFIAGIGEHPSFTSRQEVSTNGTHSSGGHFVVPRLLRRGTA